VSVIWVPGQSGEVEKQLPMIWQWKVQLTSLVDQSHPRGLEVEDFGTASRKGSLKITRHLET